MGIDYVSLFAFAFVTTFTPGPNTISSASMGLNYGYKRAFNYLLGIGTGFFLVMLSCAFLSSLIKTYLPKFVTVLSIIGSLYILYLAFHTLKSTYTFEKTQQKPLGYAKGILLQILNPKVIILGLTVYSTFLMNMSHTFLNLFISAFGLTVMSFTAISTWAQFGSLIGESMKKEKTRKITNIILALLLTFTAIKMLLL
ncbi:MAG: LysE family translocator [Sphaerochaeta sp.]|nr:LysE family translocator [Sphaerochaeta sp.]